MEVERNMEYEKDFYLMRETAKEKVKEIGEISSQINVVYTDFFGLISSDEFTLVREHFRRCDFPISIKYEEKNMELTDLTQYQLYEQLKQSVTDLYNLMKSLLYLCGKLNKDFDVLLYEPLLKSLYDYNKEIEHVLQRIDKP